MFNVGLTNLYINAYDGSHQIKIFEKMISDSKIDRKKLAKKDRSSKPCNTCSINGTLHGKESFNLLKDYLKL